MMWGTTFPVFPDFSAAGLTDTGTTADHNNANRTTDNRLTEAKTATLETLEDQDRGRIPASFPKGQGRLTAVDVSS